MLPGKHRGERSFITGLADDLEGESLVYALVQLGKAPCIETIAEGIEQRELSLLRGEQGDGGQGFLLLGERAATVAVADAAGVAAARRSTANPYRHVYDN